MKEIPLITLLLATFSFGDIQVAPKERIVEKKRDKYEFSTDWRECNATYFWVNEPPSEDNKHIGSADTAYVKNWYIEYGGPEDPTEKREASNDYKPKAFDPKENHFFVAIPYIDLENGTKKEEAEAFPWFKKLKKEDSIIKNVWVEIEYGNKTCYAQVVDVGPIGVDRFRFVLTGKDEVEWEIPGINLSLAVRDFLDYESGKKLKWRFCVSKEELEKKDFDRVAEGKGIPDGPWKIKITDSGMNW